MENKNKLLQRIHSSKDIDDIWATIFLTENLNNSALLTISQTALCSLSDDYLTALFLTHYFHMEGIQTKEAEDAYCSIAAALAVKAGYHIPENILYPYFIGIITSVVDQKIDNELAYEKLQKTKAEIQRKIESKPKREKARFNRNKWRVACIALACVMAIGITVGSANPKIREAVIEVITGENAQQVVVQPTGDVLTNDDLRGVLYPKALENDYAIYKVGDFSNNYTLFFSDPASGEQIVFEVKHGSTSIVFDQEYTITEHLEINGYSSYLANDSDSICLISYLQPELAFSLTAPLSIGRERLIEIAESVRR